MGWGSEAGGAIPRESRGEAQAESGDRFRLLGPTTAQSQTHEDIQGRYTGSRMHGAGGGRVGR